MRFVNLMRQEIRIIPIDGTPDIVIPSSGLVFINEVNERHTVHDEVYGDIPVMDVQSQVMNMPDRDEDVAYIVPWKVLQALRASGYDVSDLYCPDAAVRGERGMIIGSRSLLRYTQ